MRVDKFNLSNSKKMLGKMKKSTLIILVIPLLVFSQKKEIKNDSIEFKYNLKINTLAIFKDYYHVKFETLLTEKSTFQIGFGTGTSVTEGEQATNDYFELFGSSSNSTEYKRTIDGYNVDASYRYFISRTKNAPQGPVIGLGIYYIDSSDKFESVENKKVIEKTEYSIINLSLTMGFQYVLFNQLIINPYLSAGYAFGDVDDVSLKGTSVGYGIDFGFVF